MDDVTIEDELDGNEQVSSQSDSQINRITWFYIFQIFSQPWMVLLFISVLTIAFLYLRRNRRDDVISPNATGDLTKRYEEMERAREKQQKAYEEHALRRAEEKKKRLESLETSTTEKSQPMKYRSDDHNPLTGQSTKGKNDSCSWRSSSRRKPAGG